MFASYLQCSSNWNFFVYLFALGIVRFVRLLCYDVVRCCQIGDTRSTKIYGFRIDFRSISIINKFTLNFCVQADEKNVFMREIHNEDTTISSMMSEQKSQKEEQLKKQNIKKGIAIYLNVRSDFLRCFQYFYFIFFHVITIRIKTLLKKHHFDITLMRRSLLNLLVDLLKIQHNVCFLTQNTSPLLFRTFTY